jgi:hypothetical protein
MYVTTSAENGLIVRFFWNMLTITGKLRVVWGGGDNRSFNHISDLNRIVYTAKLIDTGNADHQKQSKIVELCENNGKARISTKLNTKTPDTEGNLNIQHQENSLSDPGLHQNEK